MVVDSSSLISLSRAGLLGLIDRSPLPIVLPDPVWTEVVEDGKALGHPDALVIEAALDGRARTPAPPSRSVDHAVMLAAKEDGTLLANDLTLGKRSRSAGARWLRTPDFIVLLHRTGAIGVLDARSSVASLQAAGRITRQLRDAYLEVLR